MLKLVVAKGMALAIIGTAIGLIAALALTRLMRSLLWRIVKGLVVRQGGGIVFLIWRRG